MGCRWLAVGAGTPRRCVGGSARRKGVRRTLFKRRREALFDVTKKISGINRLTELKEPKDKRLKYCYTMRPQSRYTSLPAGVPRELYAAVCPLGQFHSDLSEGNRCNTPLQPLVDTAQSPITPRAVSCEL